MEWFIILLVGAGIAIFYSSRKKVKDDRATAEAGDRAAMEADAAAFIAAMPPRPHMNPPPEGGMSVGVQKTDGFVWVWLDISETTKQTLSRVMDQTVDEIPTDDEERTERSVREHLAAVDGTFANARERQEYSTDFRRKMFAPTPVTLGEMFANPFRYPTPNAHDAAEYTEQLKTKVLPKIKAMIEGQSRPQTESFEL